jgi:hypothetical protein
MPAKFNFLNRRTAANKAAADLRRQFPKRSAIWINAKARQAAGADDITMELRAPMPASSDLRGGK